MIEGYILFGYVQWMIENLPARWVDKIDVKELEKKWDTTDIINKISYSKWI